MSSEDGMTDDEADEILRKLGILDDDDTQEAKDAAANTEPTSDDEAPLGKDGLPREPVKDADRAGRTKRGTFTKGNKVGDAGRKKQALEKKKERTKLPTFRSALRDMMNSPRKRDRFDVGAASRKIVRQLFTKAGGGDLRAAELILKYLDSDANQHHDGPTIIIQSGVPENENVKDATPSTTEHTPRLRTTNGKPGPADFEAIDKLKGSRSPNEQSKPATEIVLTGKKRTQPEPPKPTDIITLPGGQRIQRGDLGPVKTWDEIMGITKVKQDQQP